jgi:hypothetical protein
MPDLDYLRAYAEKVLLEERWNIAKLDERPGAALRLLAPQMKAAHDDYMAACRLVSGPRWCDHGSGPAGARGAYVDLEPPP